MKKCLLEDKKINDGNPKIKIKFNEEMFLNAVDAISKDIMEKYDLENKKIGLLGVARGALPLLVAVSHRTGVRDICVAQIKMTNSNEKWDYGEAKWVNGYLCDDTDEYIIFEDMVSHGRSIGVLINKLKDEGKKVIDVYTLVLNEDMKNITIENENMDINYAYMIDINQWVYFFWEKGYIEKNE